MLEILNIAAGHMKFDFTDEGDEEKASRIIQEMLRMGYAIFVETEEGLRRVKAFDPKEKVYLVGDEVVGDEEPKKKKPKKMPLKTTRATGVGATAGG